MIKKGRQGESKKPSASSNVKSQSGAALIKKEPLGDESKLASRSNSDTADTKPKVVNVAAKPSSFLKNLKSASKRPGTSIKADETNSKYSTFLRPAFFFYRKD